MDYYYDILLNFQENYYMFYEWEEEDNLEYIKKIPLIHVDSKTILQMISKVIMVNMELLKKIENKTKLKNNANLKYTAIFSDGKNALALEFSDDGKVISKSSLILEDELNVNEFMYNIALSKIDYQVIGDAPISKETRQEKRIKKVLQLELEKMYQNKEYSKLKYIYLEWFNKLEDNINLMYQSMLNKLKDNLTEKEYSIYELIKLSYNNV